MRSVPFLAVAAATTVTALPHLQARQSDSNPFEGRQLYVNPNYSESLEQTREAFLAQGDTQNAGKVRYVQERVGSFVWVPTISHLKDIDAAIANARAARDATGQDQVVGLVLYNLPDRDCSAGESAGELRLDENGLERYRLEFVDPFAQKVKEASDLTFAIVLEPDAVGNIVTNQQVEFCANAAEPHQEGIAYAVSQLQADNVALYIDASHGGWLGWDANLAPTAQTFASIVQRAGNNSRVRGFSTNVSNYNAFHEPVPPPFTDGSSSYDESSYASSLAPHLEAEGLPARFIVDQGRVAIEGAREDWGEWCNVVAGFGQPATTQTDNPYVDAIVWVKPGGESDGECGLEGAPIAGAWFDEYAQLLAVNAHSEIVPLE
ncbi:endoglucanase-6B [Sodiomyces alkalinus F11]|uniref:Glucanase n=1 Tax=Sodiomyces alkalinus (strain CBS 110278 / VKM F-3762 / F11) TaxID=1314773 RepID=A0A3N2PKS1_SODAK|nr:endoglucanase-6B [Sodiomyces alkalinus F11]ROT35128.1 endoglucanase-6B [Sodiomyces alkalinus F11]